MVDDDTAPVVDAGEGEVASTDLRSTIEGALEKQREASVAPTEEAPIEADKPPREDGRDEKGRFAPKEPKEAVEATAEPVESEAKEPEPVEAHKPPIGWSVAAKADWANLPPHVQEAVAKREAEVNAGFARYSGLKEHVETAERNGTTLAAVMQNVRALETLCERDILGGIDAIVARMGYDPRAVSQYYAARHGVPSSGQIGQGYQQPQFDPDEIISAAEQRALAKFEETQVRRESASEIERFAADPAHAYFYNVREDMALLLQNGKAESLKDAYEMACWANPETRAIMLKSQTVSTPSPAAAVQKAKAAAKAVGGAPSPGFNPSPSTPPKNMSIREAAEYAVRMQRGG